MNGIERLQSLRRDTLAVGEEMNEQRRTFKALEKSEPVRAISSFNLFQTPEHVADRMAALLGPSGRVLEPSAGLGRLIKATQADEWMAIDISPDCCRELNLLGVATLCRDFLSVTPQEIGMFDAVIMNPPFKMGTDVKHINHAMQFVKPGGKVVALCYNGTRQNQKLKPIATTWEVLPEDSFKSEGTHASVCMLSIVNSPSMATII